MTSTAPLTEATTEHVVQLDPSINVTHGVLALFEASPAHPVYAVPNGSGGWVDVTIRSFVAQVRAVAKGSSASAWSPASGWPSCHRPATPGR
ncbi:hypothetical protein [Nesterenkonia sp. PF2B19]|uniref:hypothetical protein n=1 Tax=Nesterenkonia sp. PF2B19 TaxID=1881858 RepID=UPI0030146D2C